MIKKEKEIIQTIQLYEIMYMVFDNLLLILFSGEKSSLHISDPVVQKSIPLFL